MMFSSCMQKLWWFFIKSVKNNLKNFKRGNCFYFFYHLAKFLFSCTLFVSHLAPSLFPILHHLAPSLFLSLENKNNRCKKKLNYKTQDNNQIIYKSKSCRAAEFSKFCKFSIKCKTGLASIAVGCLGGSENPSSSLIVPQIPLPPKERGNRRLVGPHI